MSKAEYAMAMALLTGSVGSLHKVIENGIEIIEANVVRLNEDGTEKKPN